MKKEGRNIFVANVYQISANIYTKRQDTIVFSYCAVTRYHTDGFWQQLVLRRGCFYCGETFIKFSGITPLAPARVSGNPDREHRTRKPSMAHVAASLSAGPVLHHRSTDRKRDARTRHRKETRKRERKREKGRKEGGEREKEKGRGEREREKVRRL